MRLVDVGEGGGQFSSGASVELVDEGRVEIRLFDLLDFHEKQLRVTDVSCLESCAGASSQPSAVVEVGYEADAFWGAAMRLRSEFSVVDGWHEATSAAMSLVSTEAVVAATVDSEPDEVWLFVDGSSKDSEAGWSLLVITARHGHLVLDHCAGIALCGFTCGNLSGLVDIGVSGTESEEAELVGVAAAYVWARDCVWASAQFTVFCDNANAIALATGANGAQSTLVEVIQARVRESLAMRSVRIEHVKGHCGHPWNEAVDVLSKQFRSRKLEAFRPDHTWLVPEGVEAVSARRFSHLAWHDAISAVQYPSLVGGNVVASAPWQSVMPSAIAARYDRGEVRKPRVRRAGNKAATVVFVSVNVRTLSDGPVARGSGLCTVGRSAWLMEQFAATGASLVGIQESQTSSGVRVSGKFVVISSGRRSQSDRGCELWVLRSVLWDCDDLSSKSFASVAVKTLSVCTKTGDGFSLPFERGASVTMRWFFMRLRVRPLVRRWRHGGWRRRKSSLP